jgi:hypothetical protein
MRTNDRDRDIIVNYLNGQIQLEMKDNITLFTHLILSTQMMIRPVLSANSKQEQKCIQTDV